jgi:hypothetical protein
MAVSGSKDFELDVAEYIEEAFERCGKISRSGYDLQTAKRSLNLLFAEWSNLGINQWTVQQTTIPMVSGTGTYLLDADTVDIINAVLRRGGTDYSVDRLSRADWLNVPDKTQTGRPFQYFLDRLITPELKLYQVPDNSTDIFVIDRLVRIDDADKPSNTVQLPFRFYAALAAGLAYYLSIKKAPDRTPMLKAEYVESLTLAISGDRDRSSHFVVPPRYGNRG